MPSRRDFLRTAGTLAGGCIAHVALAAACATPAARRRWTAPARVTVAESPFARLERVAPDTWALVSTPLGGDRTTFANGGIVAGRSGVLVIEGFYRAAGAEWLARQARALTGRWPTHVLVTHYHVDHAAGLAGYATAAASEHASPPRVHATDATRARALGGGPVAPPRDDALTRALADVVLLPADGDATIDLGGRTVRVRVGAGHTASDAALLDDDAGLAWLGDLLWNGMFPNYVDATPSRLAATVRALTAERRALWVPGHGPLADAAAVARYRDLLDDVERAARAAHRAGRPAAEGAAAYAVPPSLGEWMAGRPALERAFAAWYRELGPRGQ